MHSPALQRIIAKIKMAKMAKMTKMTKITKMAKITKMTKMAMITKITKMTKMKKRMKMYTAQCQLWENQFTIISKTPKIKLNYPFLFTIFYLPLQMFTFFNLFYTKVFGKKTLKAIHIWAQRDSVDNTGFLSFFSNPSLFKFGEFINPYLLRASLLEEKSFSDRKYN